MVALDVALVVVEQDVVEEPLVANWPPHYSPLVLVPLAVVDHPNVVVAGLALAVAA